MPYNGLPVPAWPVAPGPNAHLLSLEPVFMYSSLLAGWFAVQEPTTHAPTFGLFHLCFLFQKYSPTWIHLWLTCLHLLKFCSDFSSTRFLTRLTFLFKIATWVLSTVTIPLFCPVFPKVFITLKPIIYFTYLFAHFFLFWSSLLVSQPHPLLPLYVGLLS